MTLDGRPVTLTPRELAVLEALAARVGRPVSRETVFNRVFEFEQVSINNTSRTEIVKVPTPDLPSDSLGGSVNLVSKNAFERNPEWVLPFKCISCGICVKACPHAALEIVEVPTPDYRII